MHSSSRHGVQTANKTENREGITWYLIGKIRVDESAAFPVPNSVYGNIELLVFLMPIEYGRWDNQCGL